MADDISWTVSVMVIVAYILAIAGAVVVKSCVGVLDLIILAFLLPLQSLVSRNSTVDQLHAFSITCFSAFISVLAASTVFQWLSSHFSFTSVLMLAAPFVVADLSRIRRSLGIWSTSLIETGLEWNRLIPNDQPLETRLLYNDVGREIAYMAGDVVGFAIGGWYFLYKVF